MNARENPRRRTSLMLTILAFLAVYLVWGSTYLVIRIGVRELSPSVLMGLRFLIAGSVNLLVWGVFDRRHMPTPKEVLMAAVAGVIMLVGGTGVVGYAERAVNSSTTALLVSASPFWFAIGDYLLTGRALLRRQVWGILAGFAGVWILVWPALRTGTMNGVAPWTLALLMATLAWVSAGLFSKRRRMPRSIFLTAGVEMVAAGCVLMILGAALGEYSVSSLAHYTAKAWMAIAYLAFFGSCIAFTAYAWLLKHQPTHRVASYAYVNPVVAVLLGVLFDGDPFTLSILLALALITAGVTLTMSRREETDKG